MTPFHLPEDARRAAEEVSYDRDQLRRLTSLDAPQRGGNILDQMADMIARHAASLCRGDFRGFPPIMRDQIARDMLRVEVSHDAEYEMLRAMDHNMRLHAPQLGRTAAPFKLVGVSVYVVSHDIPAPGWRIVNPFHVKEPTP